MHIKLVVNAFPVNSETFIVNLVIGLEAKGHIVSICAMSKSTHEQFFKEKIATWSRTISIMPFSKNKFALGVDIVKLLFTNTKKCIYYISKKGIIKGIISATQFSELSINNPDIIHFAYSGIAISFLDILPDIEKSKIMVSCRGTAEKVKPLIDINRREKLISLFTHCDAVHCVSEDMQQEMTQYELNTSKSFINYPSIDTNYFERSKPYNSSSKKHFTIVSTGRLHFSKGYVYSLQAMKILKEKGFLFTYLIIGDGSEYDMLSYMIHQFGLIENVKLLGKKKSEEVRKILLDADIYLLTSIYEGVSNAVLEAMSMKIPVVATKAGGMGEAIVNEENGILVERFSPNSIADGLIKLIESVALRKKISENSRGIILEKFHISRQIEIFEQQYKKLYSTKK
jgi:colanic acid/amylovoran biosynthesis glycosyltransferase